MRDLPIIDVTDLRSGDQARRVAVGRKIAEACTTAGFFYIVNHGVSESLIDSAIAESLAFFHQPLEVKAKTKANVNFRGFHATGGALMYGADKPDFKEFFQIGLDLAEDDPDVLAGQPLRGPNQWPETPPGFRPAMEAYYTAIGECGADLLRGVALALTLPETFFRDRYAKPLQRTQAIYYPPQPEEMGPDQYGVACHTDYGCITLLYQDDVGGLEVLNRDGQWVEGPPVPGSFVVNVGDLLQRWSNDHFLSNAHRVRNTSGRERFSIATFYDPSYDSVVDPRDLLSARGAEEAPRHVPISAGDHIWGRIVESGRHRKEKAKDLQAQ
ncbi:MAG: isopenicillin N synthase family oxygenase [Rhodospirillum sp.]|nr:isopenicillin N synthase family oxygenase [Rhodospirillum sp.]MCF8491839.1 isopenicillin N synthase family oxygenase [Rhodospirillum sp.]MCF8502460.1 isopenicillin N synthase family oxygenase [Rhodospirillum sp.]